VRSAWLFTLAIAGSAAASSAFGDALITDPTWLEKPSGEDLAHFAPRRAAEYGVSGRVLLTCRVKTDGRLAGCGITEEAPQGWGYGGAALRMSAKFRMQPKMVGGQPEGGSVRFPVNFVTRMQVPLICTDAPAATRKCEVDMHRVLRQVLWRDADRLALTQIEGSEPPPDAKKPLGDGRYLVWVSVRMPFQPCPTLGGEPRCDGATKFLPLLQ